MMHAYNENYLNSAMVIFAEMIDYAVNDCGIDGDLFMHMFVVTGAAQRFERGHLKYVTGRSGIEIADEIIQKARDGKGIAHTKQREGRSPEYWAGWALAQYQWYTAKAFRDIQNLLPLSSVIKLYPTLHEADITKFYDVADHLIAKQNPPTNLKRIRTAIGITQEKLASESGVSLRSIQMYEQRNKDINKAQAISLAKISRVLGCEVEDLLETERREDDPLKASLDLRRNMIEM